MALDPKSAPWGNECAGAACDTEPNMAIPAPAMVKPVSAQEYEQMRRYMEEKIRSEQMHVHVPTPELPFLGRGALSQYDRLARQMNRNHDLSCTDEAYFEKLVGTMDAIKDTVQWVMAQIKVVEMTFKDDPARRQLHVSVLRNGFMVMVRQASGEIKHGDFL